MEGYRCAACRQNVAPAEDAFDHRPTRLRHAIAFVPRGASVDGAPTTLAGCGDAVVLRHMRRNIDGAQVGHMVSRVIGLIFAYRDAAAGLPGFGLEHGLRGAALGSAIGERDHAAHAGSPWWRGPYSRASPLARWPCGRVGCRDR